MNTRPQFLRWPARRPILDNQACSDLDEASILRNHRPIYQRPARKPMRLVGIAAAIAIVGAAFIAAFPPTQTVAAVAVALASLR